ncbi:P-loop containing nucleoside triphosphate hydrolase protein [Mucidula mucida]|nr:P-loop containing nucleoside triphosphate hydrolase protein [Mucidula mucida]
MRGGRRLGRASGRTVGDAFNPDDTENVQHTRLGVWDLYEDKPEVLKRIPWSARLQPYIELGSGLPYVWKMLKDISGIRSTWILLIFLTLLNVIKALLPAVSLWYAQNAIDERKVDKRQLLVIAAGRVGLNYLHPTLNSRIKQHYSMHMFRVVSRLDLVTFNDDAVQEQISQVAPANSHSSVAWDTITSLLNIFTTALRLISQSAILIRVVRDQPDGHYLHSCHVYPPSPNSLKSMVNNGRHRQEMVAGEMWRYLRLRVESFYQLYQRHNESKFWSLLHEPLGELPQIVFTLRVVERPASIPLSLASLNLMTSTANSFSGQLVHLLGISSSIVDNISRVRKLYEAENIPNKIADGTTPYPENQADLRSGVSIEFRNVSFKYPDAPDYALQNVSFKIEQGQLCVIVGKNGSGKSTILKLIARFHDPAEGTIFVDGHDIQTLRLEDLRRATAVLFQDYSHFPLSIGDNIGLGDPESSTDADRILEAARLGGADEVVAKLPERFGTYLERPVRDMYSPLPEGTKMLFGRPVDYSKLRRKGGMRTTESALSGGQMQRIALSKAVGLLLFDEPSASLDPTAEHDLFERLRHLRGNKTMIFSSHRFGNLTRHADLILGGYTHSADPQGREYARIWKIQAEAFLS